MNVRNPWGSFEWNGDWGDNSDLWAAAAKAEVQSQVNYKLVTDKDDGAFWLSFENFKQFFPMIFIS